ncbi:MAG: hypothetical protein V4642_13075 [Bacteroidota bacterium]
MEATFNEYGIAGMRAEKILNEIGEIFEFDSKFKFSLSLANQDVAWENGWSFSDNILTELSSLSKEQQLFCLQLIDLKIDSYLQKFEPLENEQQTYKNAFHTGISLKIDRLIKEIEEKNNPRIIEYNLIHELKKEVINDFKDTLNTFSESTINYCPENVQTLDSKTASRKEIHEQIVETYKEMDERGGYVILFFLQQARWKLRTLAIEPRKICFQILLSEFKKPNNELDTFNALIVHKLGGLTFDADYLFTKEISYARLKNRLYMEFAEVLHNWLIDSESLTIPNERGNPKIEEQNNSFLATPKILKAKQKQVAACVYDLIDSKKTIENVAEIGRIVCKNFSFNDKEQPQAGIFTQELYKFKNGTAYIETCLPTDFEEIQAQILPFIAKVSN